MKTRKIITPVLLAGLIGVLATGSGRANDLFMSDVTTPVPDGRTGSLGYIHLQNPTSINTDDNVTLSACGGVLIHPGFTVQTGAILSINVTLPGDDSDTDTISDCTEMFYFATLDQDLSSDFDNDGLSNAEEMAGSSSPSTYDTDGDGLPDGWESEENVITSNGEKVKGSFYQYDALGRIISKMRTTKNQ